MDLLNILKTAVEHQASDIHLAVDSPPMVRIQGTIAELPGFAVLSEDACKDMIYSVLKETLRAKFEQDLELDCSIGIQGLGRFRMNVMYGILGVEAALRHVPPTIPSPEILGLGPRAMALADLPRGLVLVTGPTGCGKSTTLACMVDRINHKYQKHVITIEDPIEFVHQKHMSLIRQREVGPHTKSFGEALRHALRQDPDVIMVGELRDLETISLAITAAETGHLCFATLHTINASQTVNRILDVFPAEQQLQVRAQLANSLRGVLSQNLLTRKDGNGLVAARELMLMTPGIANLFREGKIHQIPNAIETGSKQGMYAMDKSIVELVRQGFVTPEEGMSKCHNAERVETDLRNMGMAPPKRTAEAMS